MEYLICGLPQVRASAIQRFDCADVSLPRCSVRAVPRARYRVGETGHPCNRAAGHVGSLEDLNASTELADALVIDREQALSKRANATRERDSEAAKLGDRTTRRHVLGDAGDKAAVEVIVPDVAGTVARDEEREEDVAVGDRSGRRRRARCEDLDTTILIAAVAIGVRHVDGAVRTNGHGSGCLLVPFVEDFRGRVGAGSVDVDRRRTLARHVQIIMTVRVHALRSNHIADGRRDHPAIFRLKLLHDVAQVVGHEKYVTPL